MTDQTVLSPEDITNVVFPWRVRDDGVVVLPTKAKDKQGEILLPEVARKKPLTGTVIATGSKVDDRGPNAIPVGKLVLYGRYAGHEIEIEAPDGRKYILLRADDVRAVLEG